MSQVNNYSVSGRLIVCFDLTISHELRSFYLNKHQGMLSTIKAASEKISYEDLVCIILQIHVRKNLNAFTNSI